MGLPRPSEPFRRVYSAPEPPSPARRPRLVALLVAVVSFVLAAGAVFWLGSRGESPTAAPGRPSATAPPETDPAPSGPAPSGPAPSRPAPTTSRPPAPPSQAAPITRLPAPCGMVAAATVRRLVPSARRSESANPILATCTYTSTGGRFRWLWVEARLYSPGDHAAPLEDARRYYSAQQTQARNDAQAETRTLEPQRGLGDEAYRQFKVDRGQPTAVGQVTARVRNVVVTVSYSEQAPGKGEAEERERGCLAKATQVAREVLGEFR
ncbi:hypothetical protein ACFQU9_01130 [Actinomadura namibiensis]|uniref:DUF3558 domain-containing protein n=1 Tax=Actinomadura namibiensis TaxID=182080 RepID=A0A7W3QL91_ACTNM|nr:hypothetical protein [Actinomadura namibiensis]MBA8951191.1 hypothetical protein [Actinomadura namibiensis]